MSCPNCRTALEDVLEFDRLGPLRCPACGHVISEREITHGANSETATTGWRAERSHPHRLVSPMPQWV